MLFLAMSEAMIFFQSNAIFAFFCRCCAKGMVVAISVGGLSGCASIVDPADPEPVVRERAQARWNAVIAGSWDRAYSFATPGFRGAVDVQGFRARSSPAAKLKAADVVNVKCKDVVCDVTMRIVFSPLQRGFPEAFTDREERWVLEGGEWWRHERY